MTETAQKARIVYLTVHTTVYEPWEDGADERKVRSQDEETIEIEVEPGESMADAINSELEKWGATSYSSSEFDGSHGWYSDPDGYEHPHTGRLEMVSAHLKDFSEGDARQVYDRTIRRIQPANPYVRQLTDAQARVAAAQWQSSGYEGNWFAALASSGRIVPDTESQIDRQLRQADNDDDRRQLAELLNYVRTQGVRSDRPGWASLWDADYEHDSEPKTPERTRPRPGAWGRKEYEPLAAMLSRSGDREALADHFGHALVGTNPYFDRYKFTDAAGSAEGYQVRAAVRARPKFGKNHVAFLASVVEEYRGDRHALGHGMADFLGQYAPRFDRAKFLKEAGVDEYRTPIPPTDANGEYAVRVVQPGGSPFDVHFESKELANQARLAYDERGWDASVLDRLRQVERGELPSGSVIAKVTGSNSMLTPGNSQTSGDGPRDNSTTNGRNTSMSAQQAEAPVGGGEGQSLPSSLAYAEGLAAWAEEASSKGLEGFVAGLRSHLVTGDGVEKFVEGSEALQTAAACFRDGHAALSEQLQLRDLGQSMEHGDYGFVEGGD